METEDLGMLDHGEIGHSHEVDGSNITSEGKWLNAEQLAPGAIYTAGMVVDSAEMKRQLAAINRIAAAPTTVLIQGESGTGKELVARAIHSSGPNSSGPFVVFNCSNLVEALAESQLFGHVRGAFTDAREESLGYFRAADGGTLFLDEVGELPLRLQPKLLRAVENWEIQPVGSQKTYRVKVRLLAATNRDVKGMITSGQFRTDLYYRLAAALIEIAPLRARRDDIAALVAHFIGERGDRFGREINYLSAAALRYLTDYDWPGNVRQLAHAIESSIITADRDRIDVMDLPQFLRDHYAQASSAAVAATNTANTNPGSANLAHDRPVSLEESNRQAVIRSLVISQGNRKRAAELLGISRPRLYRMLASLGIEHIARSSHPGRRSELPPEIAA